MPVADLLAREGRPLDVDDDFLLTDALVSVRRGMAGLAAGLLVVVGGTSIAGQLLGGNGDDRASSDDGRSVARERTARPAETSTIGIDVADVASRTRSAAQGGESGRRAGGGSGQAGGGGGQSTSDARPGPATPRTTSATPAPAPPKSQQRTREASGGGDHSGSGDYREWSGDYGRDWSGDYGRDWSGDYGADYWGG
ncbi:hypothetical protein [Haloechinothrix salitolerans]|uniref:Uncharacterized protein n=1 Tax=Haloechinothrix salitolerans TaxID=926830 RepID=A0ABW2C7K2_9PSEU